MLELEFLGVQPDGNHMTLNDSDGNRYSLPITDELRAALRRDRVVSPTEDPKPMSPRDIQAHFRAGRTLEELSELTSMPASQLSPYEFPILAEREYAATQARSYRIGHEIGALTVEELVTSRLKSRDVASDSIAWSAIREPGKNWQLTATYTVAGRETVASWSINQQTSSLTALNDEARWLSETEIPIKDSPWRPLSVSPLHSAEEDEVVLQSAVSATETHASSATVASAPEATDPEPQESNSKDSDSSIVSMLDTLSARRGTKQAISIDDSDDIPPAAHPPASRPEEATDATVLSLPPRPSRTPNLDMGEFDGPKMARPASSSARSAEPTAKPEYAPSSNSSAAVSAASSASPSSPAQATNTDSTSADVEKNEATEDDGLFKDPESKAPKRRKRGSNRPAMPSWDEIVFGQSKD
ncbi:MAG: septation protein SepH [Flaviflexus sp.]|uniref:septation protein SepH n=1 Tax=Flaviflexus sp. TaxID=1969482 RepID=UPI00352C43C2